MAELKPCPFCGYKGVEILADDNEYLYYRYFAQFKTYAKLAIEALKKENGVTVQEWISTDKRMPTQEDATTEYVFTAYKNKNCYDVNISLWDTIIAYPDLYDYWMPLPMPEPPKGE